MPRNRWKVGLVMVALTLAAVGLGWPQQAGEAQSGDDVDAFVQHHWRLPVPPQGEPPAAFSPIEASLHPKECALCHRQQFEDWKTSLHSRSMGPGIYGQLLNMQDKQARHVHDLRHLPHAAQRADSTRQGRLRIPSERVVRPGITASGADLRRLPRAAARALRTAAPPGGSDAACRRGAAARRFHGYHGIPALGVLQAVPPVP